MAKIICKDLDFYRIGGFVLLLSFLLDKTIANLNIQNKYLDYLFGSITNYATVIFIMLIMTSLFLYDEGKKKWIKPLWTSFIVTFIMVLILKNVFVRARPADIDILHPLFLYSFPSLHTATAFSVLPILDKEFPRIKWAFIMIAIFIALNRIYFSAHYLSDVVAGALIGYLGGDIIWNLK